MAELPRRGKVLLSILLFAALAVVMFIGAFALPDAIPRLLAAVTAVLFLAIAVVGGVAIAKASKNQREPS